MLYDSVDYLLWKNVAGKEQLQLDQEKKLVDRERKIMEANWIPDNTMDFDRLLVGTPNSSALWIRYVLLHSISFIWRYGNRLLVSTFPVLF